MPSNAIKKMLKKLAVFVLPFVLLLKPAGIAHAFFHDELISALKGEVLSALMDGFQWVGAQIAYWISYLATFLISLAGAFIKILIDAGTEVISNPLTTTGFRISLDVANLGFVLAIIVIAFTTMFRVSGYETKKLLRNLIFAAVLVNFSLTIAGTLLDFSNVFGNFFLNAASPGDRDQFAANLANSLNVQKLTGLKIEASQSNGASLFTFGAGYLSVFVTLAATAIFNVALVITFFAIAVMLLIRYVYIVFLLIVMPIAWLMWVFPGYSHLFSSWWKQYMKWMTFYPAVTFFLYLAIASAAGVGDIVDKASSGSSALTAAKTIAGVSEKAVVGFIQIFVQVALMFGGLIAANKLGIEGGKAGLDLFKGLKTGFVGKGVNWQKIGQKVGEKGAQGIARTPVLGTMAAPILSALSPTFRKERGALREASIDRSGGQIAQRVKSGEMSLDEVRRRAGSIWHTKIPILGKRRANNIAALAAMESGGQYQVGKEGAPPGAGEWQNPEVSDKEKKLIDEVRKRKAKKEKEKSGPSIEERLKKIEEEKEEEKK